jgi:hypothetical protein
MQLQIDDTPSFKKSLLEFWQTKGIYNLKIPQIGGKELDFYKLYNSVIKKGGA